MATVSIGAAARMMDVPVEWVAGMIEAGEIEAFDGPSGPEVEADVIRGHGWDVQCELDAVPYAHTNALLVTLSLRVLH